MLRVAPGQAGPAAAVAEPFIGTDNDNDLLLLTPTGGTIWLNDRDYVSFTDSQRTRRLSTVRMPATLEPLPKAIHQRESGVTSLWGYPIIRRGSESGPLASHPQATVAVPF